MASNAMKHALELLRTGTLSIDDDGRIWRHKILAGRGRVDVEKRRAENIGGKGYFRLTMQIDGRLRSVMAHRVVWTFLRGPIPDGLQINHKDSDKQNNNISNLEVVDASGNMRHSYASGNRPKPWHKTTHWRGRKRVSQRDKDKMRSMRKDGARLIDIARPFGVSVSYAQLITRKA